MEDNKELLDKIKAFKAIAESEGIPLELVVKISVAKSYEYFELMLNKVYYDIHLRKFK